MWPRESPESMEQRPPDATYARSTINTPEPGTVLSMDRYCVSKRAEPAILDHGAAIHHRDHSRSARSGERCMINDAQLQPNDFRTELDGFVDHLSYVPAVAKHVHHIQGSSVCQGCDHPAVMNVLALDNRIDRRDIMSTAQ